MEGSTFVKCTPFTSKKQRRALKAWETKRAKAAMEEAAAEDAVTRQAAAETQRQELQARGTCAPSGAPHSCTCSDFVLSAADAIACHPCGNCGGLAPPASVAEAAAWTRAALSCGVDAAPPERRSARGSGSEAQADGAEPRPHGGPALRKMVDANLLDQFELANGPLEPGARQKRLEYAPAIIKCEECATDYYFDHVWELCHRMGLDPSRNGEYLDSPSRRYVIDTIEGELLPAKLKSVARRTWSQLDPFTLHWPQCFNCEAAACVAAAGRVWRAAASALKPKVQALRPGLIYMGCHRSEHLLVPFDITSRSRTAAARFEGVHAAIYLLPRVAGESLVSADMEVLRAAVCGEQVLGGGEGISTIGPSSIGGAEMIILFVANSDELQQARDTEVSNAPTIYTNTLP